MKQGIKLLLLTSLSTRFDSLYLWMLHLC